MVLFSLPDGDSNMIIRLIKKIKTIICTPLTILVRYGK